MKTGLEQRLKTYSLYKQAKQPPPIQPPPIQPKPGIRSSIKDTWNVITGISPKSVQRMQDGTERQITGSLRAFKDKEGNVSYLLRDNKTLENRTSTPQETLREWMLATRRRDYAKGFGTGIAGTLGSLYGVPRAVRAWAPKKPDTQNTALKENKGSAALPVTAGVLGLGALGITWLRKRKKKK